MNTQAQDHFVTEVTKVILRSKRNLTAHEAVREAHLAWMVYQNECNRIKDATDQDS